MKDFQLRVVEEKRELDEKISKLGAFLEKASTYGVEEAEAKRLSDQLTVMGEYSLILGLRIEHFT